MPTTDPDKLQPVPRFETVTEEVAKARGMKCLTRGFGVRNRKQARLLQDVIGGLGKTPYLLVGKVTARGNMVFVWK